MTGLSPKRVTTACGAVEVADSGSGPALLVLHGTPGGWQQGRLIGAQLTEQSRVLLVSRPGYGRTPLRSGRSPQEQAALYAALLDVLDIDRAVVLAISGGGPSAYAFAAQHPERCAGLLLCCGLSGHLMTPPANLRRLASVPGLWSVGGFATRTVHRLRTPTSSDPDLSSLTPAERELAADPRVLEGMVDFATNRVQCLRGAGISNDIRQMTAGTRIGQIGWPSGQRIRTVVLHGDADDVVPLSHARAYAAAIPGARLEVLAGLGHALPIFAPDRLIELAGQLLAPSLAP